MAGRAILCPHDSSHNALHILPHLSNHNRKETPPHWIHNWLVDRHLGHHLLDTQDLHMRPASTLGHHEQYLPEQISHTSRHDNCERRP